MSKNQFSTTKNIKLNIFNCLDNMETYYNDNILNLEGQHGAERERLIDIYFNEVMTNTLNEIYTKINQLSNEEFCKLRSDEIESKYFIDEQKLTQEEKEKVGKKLEHLLKFYQKDTNLLKRKKALGSVNKKIKRHIQKKQLREGEKNYIKENKKMYKKNNILLIFII